MKCDTTAISLPKKQLKDVRIGECFSMESPTGHPYVRIIPINGTDDASFIILHLHTNEFYEPTPPMMENYVYMLDATIVLKMVERKNDDSNS